MFNKQKKHFQEKLVGVDKMIWDMEFKREKTRTVREEIRQVYDQSKAKLHAKEEQIKQQAETPTMEAGEIARLDDDKVLLEKDVKRYEEQMAGLDIEVNGAAPSSDYPEGIQGINIQIDSLQELKQMLKEYIKNL